jgi:uncharacterized membrane protein (DUF106 family)
MALPGNGTTKKIVAGVVSALLIGLITQVLVNTNRLTALETQMVTIKSDMNTSRAENRDDHKTIMDKLDRIQSSVLKSKGE